ncbi:MAG: alcohol dehydrogenase catalytic domain-containing protein [Treponema sp.]|jgi:threonine 3-dehydrogenase|nr:alcohol dehydrogenase catalytic domain-containing protein [Treponema sp.]
MDTLMCGVVKAVPSEGAVYKIDLPVPSVGPRDILVEVKASAICGTDQHIYKWTRYAQERIKTPMVFGHEFSGVVVDAGADVSEVKIGDRVAGETHIPCNNCYQCVTDNRHICENMKIIGVHAPGSFAKYISFPVDCAYKISDGIDFQTASMLEPMGVAVHGIDRGEVGGKDVVVYGCGPIGLMAVGAARIFGAKTITALDVFDNKLEVAKKMGADYIVNSRTNDAAAIVRDRTGHGADVVIDYTGNNIALKSGFAMLRKGGRFVLVGLPDGDTSLPLSDCIIYKEATVIGVTGRLMYKTWEQCETVIKDPRFDIKPCLGGVYRMEDFEEAFKAIFSGAPGKMILIP